MQKITKIQEDFVEKLNLEGKTRSEISILAKISRGPIDRVFKERGLKNNVKKRKLSEKSKRLIGEKRKQWLLNNPDKHPWKNNKKFHSKPCENFKDFLKKANISFSEEHDPLIDGRFFSIDIAFPDKMIAFEINGNQHYERNGSLKPYYQDRHDILEKNGWTVYEIHYKSCFNEDIILDFVKKVQESDKKIEFDYLLPKPCKSKSHKPKSHKSKPKKKTYFCSCGQEKGKQSGNCRKCSIKTRWLNKINKKVVPTKEELSKIIWEKPMIHIAKDFRVSDVAVKKWCKKYNIQTPPTGFWQTQFFLNKVPPA